ncbi:MAG TPA: hypothetical protein VGM17_06950 [Rhizomicrobium sp.]|jgi:hypothetical protein
MTKDQIDAVFERVKTWPREKQEEAASLLLSLESEDFYELSPEEESDLREALAEMERGETASPHDVAQAFRRR